MKLMLTAFSLCLCGAMTVYGSSLDLMPLFDASSNSPADPLSSGTSNFRQRLNHHLDNSDNFTLRIQFFHTSCAKTITRFQLYPTHPDGKRRVIVGVVIYPYKHQVIVNFRQNNTAREEMFYYDVPGGTTSELSVMFAKKQLLLYINCSRIYSRRVGAIDRLVANTGDYDGLFRSKEKKKCSANSRLQAAYLLFNSEAVEALPQCVEATCGIPKGVDVKEVMKELKDATSNLRMLNDEVAYLNRSLLKWEGCECAKYCTRGDIRVPNGTEWEEAPKTCQCVNGQPVCSCKQLICSPGKSLYHAPYQPCPSCGANCLGSNYKQNHKHGDIVREGQKTCRCLNGRITDCTGGPNNGAGPTKRYEELPGCSRCCDEKQCRDAVGYCICSCSKNTNVCSRCQHSHHAVHPRNGKCNAATKILYPAIDDYNAQLKKLYPQ